MRINLLDGLRVWFNNGDIVHIRPSGNAPQLRVYAVADKQSRADEIVTLALQEPDGILRTFAGELINDVQEFQRAAIDGRVEQEVERPQRVRCDRTHRTDRGADPRGVASSVSDTALSVLPHATGAAPACLLTVRPARRSAAAARPPTPPWSLPRERAQPRPQLRLFISDDRWGEPLGRAVLTDHLACSSLGDPEPFAQHSHRGAPTVRG